MLRPDEKLIVIGPTPPPIHGVAFTTPHVVEAVRAVDRLAAHLETRDPRPVVTSGRLDARNVWLGIRHAAELLVLLARNRKTAVYLPLSQVMWGFLRDAVFIWMAVLFRRCVTVHLNGGRFPAFVRDSSPLMRRVISATMRRVDEAWVVTPAHRAMFDGLLPEHRVKVLQNTAEDVGARIDGTGSDRGSEPTRRLLFLSNLLWEKGCFDLLDALELLGERAQGMEARFVGEAEQAALDEFRHRATRLAARGISVRYDGVLTGPDKLAAFAWAQVFVLPSRIPEGQPLSLLEAMSAGLPVVSTDHPGISYTVRDGEEGLIVQPGDPEAVAGAIRRLIDDVEFRNGLRERARRRFDEMYRPESFRRAVAELLVPEPGRDRG